MAPESTLDWIALAMLPGLGPIALRRALERFPDPATIAYGIPPDAFRELPGVPAKRVAEIREARKTLRKRAEREWRRCRRAGIRLGAERMIATVGDDFAGMAIGLGHVVGDPLVVDDHPVREPHGRPFHEHGPDGCR